MAGGKAFAVDIPVTDLDENVDDFFIEEPDNGNSNSNGNSNNNDNDNENISIDLRNLDFGSGDGIVTRGWRTLSHMFGSGRGRKATRWSANSGYSDDIELINRNIHDLNSDGSSDFLDFPSAGYPGRRRRRNRFIRYVCAVFHSKLLLYLLLSVIIILLIILLVVVSKTRRMSSTSAAGSSSTSSESAPPADVSSSLLTLVLAIGALHPHFVSQDTMPFFTGLLNSSGSVYSPYLNLNSPASKLTNLWSLTTGLHPADHGIIGDSFYDPHLGETFVQYSKDPAWWNGEAVWTNAEKSGMGVVAFNWPGADASGDRYRQPNRYETFHKPDELNEQLQRLERFLSIDDESSSSLSKPDLILSYVSTLDKVVSSNGLSGEPLKKELISIDAFIMKVYQLLAKKDLSESANVIIVSEGGYVPTSEERTLYLDDLVDLSKIEHICGFPIVGLNPIVEFSVSEMIEEMKERLSSHPLRANFEIYNKDDIASTLYGGNSDRIGSILVIPKAGYIVATKNGVNELEGDYKYVNGYLADEVLSRGVFFGTGPTFRRTFGDRGAVLQPFDITDVYNIVCDSLSITGDNGAPVMTLESENTLISQWKDSKSYPGVDFDVDVLDHVSFFEAKFGSAANEELTIVEPETSDTDSGSHVDYSDDNDNDIDSPTVEDPSPDSDSTSDSEVNFDTDTDTDTEYNYDYSNGDNDADLSDTSDPSFSDDGNSAGYEDTQDTDTETGIDPDTNSESDSSSSSWWDYFTDAVDDAIDDVKHLLHSDSQPQDDASIEDSK